MKVTSWGQLIGEGFAVGAVAGVVGIFGVKWGVGVLVVLVIFVLATSVKPVGRAFVAMLVALIFAVVVSVVGELLMDRAFGTSEDRGESAHTNELSGIPTFSGQLGSGWPTEGGDFQRTGRSPYCAIENPVFMKYASNYEPFKGPNGDIYLYEQAIVDESEIGDFYNHTTQSLYTTSTGTTYFAGGDAVYAVSSQREILWRFNTSGTAYYLAPAFSSNGVMYLGTTDYSGGIVDSHIYALLTNGSLEWELTIDGQLRSSLALASDGTLFCCSCGGTLYAITPNGSVKWTRHVNVGGEVAVGPGDIVYVCGYGSLYAMYPDGTRKWECQDVDQIWTLAVATDGTACAGSADGKLYAIDANGNLKWSYTLGGANVASPTIDYNGTVYVGAQLNDYIYAIYPDGSLKWKVDTKFPIQSQVAIDKNGNLYTELGVVTQGF